MSIEPLFDQLHRFFGSDIKIDKLLSSRSGYSYKLAVNGEPMLLKAISCDEDDAEIFERVKSITKEAHLVKTLSHFVHHTYVASGEMDDSFWILRKWIEATPINEHCSYIHTKPLTTESKKRFVQDLIAMLIKVNQLYQLGYLHGDLQPHHFLVDRSAKIHLIDLELAVSRYDTKPEYRGARIDYVSPETAKRMLAGSTQIPLDMISEIYSFAAVAFYLYTGKTMTALDGLEKNNKNHPYELELMEIINGKQRSFAQIGAEPFPQLEKVLQKCLLINRKQRYQNFEEVLADLKTVINHL